MAPDHMRLGSDEKDDWVFDDTVMLKIPIYTGQCGELRMDVISKGSIGFLSPGAWTDDNGVESCQSRV